MRNWLVIIGLIIFYYDSFSQEKVIGRKLKLLEIVHDTNAYFTVYIFGDSRKFYFVYVDSCQSNSTGILTEKNSKTLIPQKKYRLIFNEIRCFYRGGILFMETKEGLLINYKDYSGYRYFTNDIQGGRIFKRKRTDLLIYDFPKSPRLK